MIIDPKELMCVDPTVLGFVYSDNESALVLYFNDGERNYTLQFELSLRGGNVRMKLEYWNPNGNIDMICPWTKLRTHDEFLAIMVKCKYPTAVQYVRNKKLDQLMI